MVEPYRIESATFTTYSGRKVTVEMETEILKEPVRKVKERILDTFCKMCSKSKDPFVSIEVKTVPAFKNIKKKVV